MNAASPEVKSVPSRRAAKTGKGASIESTVLRALGECVYEWSIPSDALRWSDGAAAMLTVADGRSLSTGRGFQRLLDPKTPASRADTILSSEQTDEGEGVAYCVQYLLAADKLVSATETWVEDTGRWYAGPDGKPATARGALRIISERRMAEERRDRMARFDTLTGLLNRASIGEVLDDQLVDMVRDGTEAGLLMVALDHFDLINSVYGHAAGDEVIAEVASRIRSNLRDVDVIARFSGAKLAVLLPGTNERDMLIAGYRVLDMMAADVVQTTGGPIAVSVSIGAVNLPRHARSQRNAFWAAQQAMQESRRNRDASLVSYRPDQRRDDERQRAARMAERIVTALKEGHIHLAWQPVVDARSGEIQFHEALLRLSHPDGTVLEAGAFIAVAEELGLIRLVDHHALDLALQTLARCPDARISLNVSNETACDPRWLSKLAAACETDITLGSRLIVEITESHAAESMEEAAQFIASVKALGCQVALDDFGAGFTSFRNLKQLPFDIIKVDGQFVDDLVNSQVNQHFIKALVDLARLFDASVVVEWVEDKRTAEMLASWGVDLLQGFRYGAAERALPWPETGRQPLVMPMPRMSFAKHRSVA